MTLQLTTRPDFEFSGEESARFATFGKYCLAAGISPEVLVEGRDPLVSRAVTIRGRVKSAVVDGYLRYLVVAESGGNLEYWVAGSNSTRSIAARRVYFHLDPAETNRLQAYSESSGQYIPRIENRRVDNWETLSSIERSVKNPTSDNLTSILHYVESSDSAVSLEAALTLRAYADFVNASLPRQRSTERALIDAFPRIRHIPTRIALAEDLGYIGTTKSIGLLSALVGDLSEHEHVRWAAIIALGRLPDVTIDNILPGLNSKLEWTSVAAVLSLSRRASERDRARLEPIFVSRLSAPSGPLLNRYAALGLSKFSKLSAATVQVLKTVIGDPDLSITVRGYAALAVSSGLDECPADCQSQLRITLDSVSRQTASFALNEPETVWAVEFLAELATLLEDTATAARLHAALADHFDDWRSNYYLCLKHYEQGESFVRQGDGELALSEFDKAERALPALAELDESPRISITFRRDIVRARLQLHTAMMEWAEVIDPNVLDELQETLGIVRQIYQRYSTRAPRVEASRSLADRELQYIQNTRDLVFVLGLLVKLDKDFRLAPSIDSIPQIRTQIENIIAVAEPLRVRFQASFARNLHSVVNSTLKDFTEALRMLDNNSLPPLEKTRLVRTTLAQIKGMFRCVTWPMPGRACPVQGLGKGKISLQLEGVSGHGTELDAYTFSRNSSVVLAIAVEITEMAPGGSTKAVVRCRLNSVEVGKELIPIVEGQYKFTMRIPDTLSNVIPAKCEISLIFEARDCQQIAGSVTAYLRSGI